MNYLISQIRCNGVRHNPCPNNAKIEGEASKTLARAEQLARAAATKAGWVTQWQAKCPHCVGLLKVPAA